MYLEDFYDFNNLWPQFKTTSIELNTTTITEPNVNPAIFYSQVAKNLKSALPNLKQVNLGGSYRFESDVVSSSDLVDKLVSTKESLIRMTEALKSQDLNVTFNAYSIEFIVSEKVTGNLKNPRPPLCF